MVRYLCLLTFTVIRFLVAFCLIGVLAACAGRTPIINDLPPGSGFTYFGFAAIDCLWDDPHDGVVQTNYAAEVAGFTNIAQLCVYSPDDALTERLETLRDYGLKSLVHVEAIFFSHMADSSSPSGDRATLRPDAASRWGQFVVLNRDVLTPENVAAIYVVDEPVWHGVEAAVFEQVLAWIKEALPNLPTMAIEAYTVADQTMAPPGLDWIGFDHYGVINPETDPEWLADYEAVRSARTRPDQRIVLVADTLWLPMYGFAGVSPAEIADLTANYYRFASANPDVIALIGYLWPDGLDDPAELGARSLPENVQRTFQAIGAKVVQPSVSPMPGNQ